MTRASDGRARRSAVLSRVPVLLIATVCALVGGFLALNGRDASTVRRANEAGAAGRFDEAVRHAERVRRAPADLRALLAIARAHTAAGRPAQADRAWAAAARRDPNNWIVHYEWARALGLFRADPARIARTYRRARDLNPRLPAPRR